MRRCLLNDATCYMAIHRVDIKTSIRKAKPIADFLVVLDITGDTSSSLT